MGQYYKVALIKNGEVTPVENTSGAKLMEHAYYNNDFVDSVMSELAFHGPARVAWVGDYANDRYGDIYETKLPDEVFDDVYHTVWDCGETEEDYREYKARLEKLTPEWESRTQKRKYKYLVNHTLKAYVNLETHRKQNKQTSTYYDYLSKKYRTERFCIHPLPLLTACGNGRGGGDYHDKYPGYADVGTWAFDELEVLDKRPLGYHKAKYCFKEE